jgi:hypothetical protein
MMQEPDLPAITDWLPIDAYREYKLFKRKDGSIIVQIRKDTDRVIYIQASLEYMIMKAEDDL